MGKRARAWVEPNPKHPRSSKTGRFVRRGTGAATKVADAVKTAAGKAEKATGSSGGPKKTIGSQAVKALDTSKLSGEKAALPKRKGVSLARTSPKVIAPAKAAPKPVERNYQPVTPQRAAQLQARMLRDQPWTAAQRDSLRSYTGTAYQDMNGALRRGGGTDRIRRHITNARAGMREIPEDITVYRGMGSGSAFGFPRGSGRLSNAQLDALVGRTWSDPGFTSTATREQGYGRGLRVQAVINAPRGTRGAFVEEITQNKGEEELVFDAGTHYRITRYERRPKNQVVLYMEVVSQDD